ncbi:MAG: GTPase [Actinomycetota bacterium]
MRATQWASIALVGRPNVGKSSILNRLLGEERSIVDASPGTTRDPIDSFIQAPNGETIRIVDTAGMRRQVQIKDPIEYFSFLRSRGTLERVDAALVVVDAGEGMTGHDQRIAREVLDSGRACAVVLNKWDLVPGTGPDRDRYDRNLAKDLRFLEWAPWIRASAKSGRGIDKLLPAILEAIEAHRTRMATAHVNRIVREAQQDKPHPRAGGRGIRILYAVQAAVAPPTFVLFTNGRLEPSYLRYLESRLRSEEPFRGTPLRLQVREKTRAVV